MVDRTTFIETLNFKTDVNYVLHDYVCVEHNHTVDELQFLINQLSINGFLDWFIQNVLDWYKRKLTVCCVQKPNPNYNPQVNGIFKNIQPEFITLYYF